MHYRILVPVLLLAVAACRDAPTAVSGPSPPPTDPRAAPPATLTRGQLLADPLTVLVAGQLRVTTAPQGLLHLASLEQSPDSADVFILQATLELIQQTAETLPADTGSGGP